MKIHYAKVRSDFFNEVTNKMTSIVYRKRNVEEHVYV